MKQKTYYFSVRKHAHDIEFYSNRLFNTMRDMESGEIPWDEARYNRIEKMYYGELEELKSAMIWNDGVTCQLTGKQLALANKIVAWASEQRAGSLIAAGKYEYLQYC